MKADDMTGQSGSRASVGGGWHCGLGQSVLCIHNVVADLVTCPLTVTLNRLGIHC